MDTQKLVVYGIILLVGIYILKDVCGVKLPFIEGFELPNNQPSPEVGGSTNVVNQGAGPTEKGAPSDLNEVKDGEWGASEPGNNEFNLPVQGIQTAPSDCYPQSTLGPADLLPEGEGKEIRDFNADVPESGEGILKGVNFLDAGFHVGVNTVGQSLRNANLNLRSEPPNPRTQVSPWMNSTIDIDLQRKPLGDGFCNPNPVEAGA